MNIVQVTPYDPAEKQNGGVMLFVQRLIKQLIKNKHTVRLLGMSYDKHTKIKEYEFIPICHCKNRKLAAYYYDWNLIIKGKKYIRENDIIHTHRIEFLLPFLKKNNPKIVTIHINFFREVYFRKNLLFAKLYSITENYILRNFERFNIKRLVFVDAETRKDYEKRFPKIKKITYTLPVGIELDQFYKQHNSSVRKSLKIPENDKVIISVGRLVKEKDLSLALRAYKLIDDKHMHFIIIGDGPDRNRLENMVKEERIPNVYFLGQKKNDEIPAILHSANLFIITSIFEGTPTTIMEALASGLPVVSTDAGGIKHVIKNKYNGEVILNRDHKLLSKKIREYINKDLRKNCIESSKKYSIQNITSEYIKIYDECYREMK